MPSAARPLLGCLLAALAACSSGRTAPPGEGLRVLFIGNSLTYANDLPGLVAALAAAGGHAFTAEAVAFPDHSLADHWHRGEARQAIARGGWDYVVLQQGPSAAPESRALLLDYTRRFAGLIREAGARPVLYMVWPSQPRAADFDGVSRSYREAAAAVDALLVPAGDAWRAAWRRDAALALYGADGLHPSPAGSYLAALAFYRTLFGRSPAGLPARLTTPAGPLVLSAPEAAVLQEAADAAAEAP